MSNNKAKDRNSEVHQKQINITKIVKKEIQEIKK
jgi:hypothetical protein